MKNRSTVFCETTVDYKYSKIFQELHSVDVVCGGFGKLLNGICTTRGRKYYHIRYLKSHGLLKTWLRYGLVFFVCRLTLTRIVWTCHNIYEHNIDSAPKNDRLRRFISAISYRIVVMHHGMAAYFPAKHRRKVVVSTFGSFRDFVLNQTECNETFRRKIDRLKSSLPTDSPVLVSVSAAKKSRLDVLLKAYQEYGIPVVVVAPGITLNQPIGSDALVYTDVFVRREVLDILKLTTRVIGFVGHENISVPTSLFMYASFGIPVIGIDVFPVNDILLKSKIGSVVSTSEEIRDQLTEICGDYESYSQNCHRFLEENTWQKAAACHAKVFK